MATELQVKNLNKRLRNYRQKYLRKDLKGLDESVTRILVNHLLTEVLGYEELIDVKTEYEIKGSYADYVIELKRKKHFEVKSVGLNLNDGHIRQTIGYAANEGIDWAILTNGRQIELYRIIFAKPINVVKLFSFNLEDVKQIPIAAKQMIYLTKHSVMKGELDNYWKRTTALSPESIARELYSEDVAKLLRSKLRKETKMSFPTEDILVALQLVILEKQDLLLKIRH